jgi:hypothetical protein
LTDAEGVDAGRTRFALLSVPGIHVLGPSSTDAEDVAGRQKPAATFPLSSR